MAATTTRSFPGLLTRSTSHPMSPAPMPPHPMPPSKMHASIDLEKRKVEARKRGQLRALERL